MILFARLTSLSLCPTPFVFQSFAKKYPAFLPGAAPSKSAAKRRDRIPRALCVVPRIGRSTEITDCGFDQSMTTPLLLRRVAIGIQKEEKVWLQPNRSHQEVQTC
jgi:hypothetical protein